MSKESSKAKLGEKKKKEQTRNSLTARGLYPKMRSKWKKEKDTNYGAVVTTAAEAIMDKLKGPIPKGMVVHHMGRKKDGSEDVGNAEEVALISFSDNVRESNYRRGGKKEAWIKKKLKITKRY